MPKHGDRSLRPWAVKQRSVRLLLRRLVLGGEEPLRLLGPLDLDWNRG